jgi:hypothetical protein
MASLRLPQESSWSGAADAILAASHAARDHAGAAGRLGAEPVTRSAVLEVLKKDYVKTAHGKGLSRGAIVRHTLAHGPHNRAWVSRNFR